MTPDYKSRISKLRQEMAADGMDTLLIFSDENRRYLSGYTAEDGNYDETAGILILSGDKQIIATDSRFDTQAALETEGFDIFCYQKGFTRELPEILSAAGGRRIGVETGRVTQEFYARMTRAAEEADLKCSFESADKLLSRLRICKDAWEIARVKEVLAIAETAFLELRETIHTGMSEKKAAWLLEKFMRQNGADGLSFPVIAASGPNSALPHAVPGERSFQADEPLLFDFGARFKGYCSDTTRTLVIGNPDETFTQAYTVLFEAQQMAVDAIAPGKKCSDIDKIARDHIDGSRFKGTFGHSLGHGVGIAIHEAPRLSSLDETCLEEGMVVTVEPGIYMPDWGGIRLENMIVVTRNGAEVLNTMGYDDYILKR